jgi:hypothetical protein
VVLFLFETALDFSSHGSSTGVQLADRLNTFTQEHLGRQIPRDVLRIIFKQGFLYRFLLLVLYHFAFFFFVVLLFLFRTPLYRPFMWCYTFFVFGLSCDRPPHSGCKISPCVLASFVPCRAFSLFSFFGLWFSALIFPFLLLWVCGFLYFPSCLRVAVPRSHCAIDTPMCGSTWQRPLPSVQSIARSSFLSSFLVFVFFFLDFFLLSFFHSFLSFVLSFLSFFVSSVFFVFSCCSSFAVSCIFHFSFSCPFLSPIFFYFHLSSFMIYHPFCPLVLSAFSLCSSTVKMRKKKERERKIPSSNFRFRALAIPTTKTPCSTTSTH